MAIDPIDSQRLETFVPVYDAIPERWEDARPFVVEQLKKIAEGVNIREIGWHLDEELLSGKQYIPSATELSDGSTSQQFRTMLRKVIPFDSGFAIGVNTKPHGIFIDANFTLIQMYAAGTNATAFTGEPIPNGADTLSYDATNVIVTVGAAYTRGVVVMEYIQEL